MTDHEIDTLVATANPLDDRAVRALELADAELALRDGVMQAPDRHEAPRRPARFRPGRRLAASFAIAVFATVSIVALAGRDPGRSGTAWAAPLVRLAESSPLLLMDLPGWTVVRADETDKVEGEMTFRLNGGQTADLHWRSGSLHDWQNDRAHDAALNVRRTVLGHTAQVTQYPEYNGIKDFTALWLDGPRVLEFRAVAADLAAFEQLLGSLKRVSVDAWLSAMPASVIKSSNRADVVKEMLADMPLPPGFDATELEGKTTVSDRYQLGAQVAGAVSCLWIDRWAAALKSGDSAGAKAAVDAMQTSHDWKVLKEMQKDGGYPDVLWDYADAMRGGDGLYHGRPLLKEVRGGLGCHGGA